MRRGDTYGHRTVKAMDHSHHRHICHKTRHRAKNRHNHKKHHTALPQGLRRHGVLHVPVSTCGKPQTDRTPHRIPRQQTVPKKRTHQPDGTAEDTERQENHNTVRQNRSRQTGENTETQRMRQVTLTALQRLAFLPAYRKMAKTHHANTLMRHNTPRQEPLSKTTGHNGGDVRNPFRAVL